MSGIIRVQKRRDSKKYAVIFNAGPQDERLSFQAKGLWVYLMTKPDDWQVRIPDLVAAGPDGLRVVRSALKELEEAGYLTRQQKRNARNQFEWETIVYECPQERCQEAQKAAAPLIQNVPMGNPKKAGAIDTFCADAKCADTKRADILSTDVPSTELLNKDLVCEYENVRPRAEPTAAVTNGHSHTQHPTPVNASHIPEPPNTATGVLTPDRKALRDAVLELTGMATKFEMGNVAPAWTQKLNNLLRMLESDKRTPVDVATFEAKWPLYLNRPDASPPSVAQVLEYFDAVFNFVPREKTNGNHNDISQHGNERTGERLSERERRFQERQDIRREYLERFGPQVAGGAR